MSLSKRAWEQQIEEQVDLYSDADYWYECWMKEQEQRILEVHPCCGEPLTEFEKLVKGANLEQFIQHNHA